ncbi:MAG: mannosyl-glycoprotein endo-beta-N-acetylglucosamidase [Gammaproteobacteria bacterium]|nr:mannosyl-glycoprotein endo-beta-N-acetylglucosamidase [Gammaproteobacteria bacterium]|tara:strand:- start:1631 stop:2098 length:468 start_codon:yes stop_codon:yes gene_type:complete
MTDAIGPKSSYDFAGLGELKAKAANNSSDDAAIKKAAQQFEAMFLQMMMKSMRATVEKGGLFDSQASETFEQMYDQQIVMAMSERGSTGLAQMVERFIRQSQGQEQDQGDQKFLVDGQTSDPLPLTDESDRFQLPEGATQQFLLNRGRFLIGGGD